MAYNGTLITVGAYVIPFIQAGTYTATRLVQDLDSYRDANGRLHRDALEHVPIKVEFETIPLNNTKLKQLMDGISSNYSIPIERKANVSVYVPEIDGYVTQEMYMVQPQPKIKIIRKTSIQYEPLKLTFIGY